MKKLFILMVAFMAGTVSAQNLYWSFDDNQQPMTIAPECDARFDEIRGGVFMPSTEDVLQYGNIFLENQSDEIRRQAPYCFLVAAFDGNAEAQFKLAQLYNKGDLLPQDDLSAYKWAFIAALNGHKEAEKFTLSLEPFLTTRELESTGSAINSERLRIQENMKKKTAEYRQEAETLRNRGATQTSKSKSAKRNLATFDDEDSEPEGHAPLPTSVTDIFSKEDHFE